MDAVTKQKNVFCHKVIYGIVRLLNHCSISPAPAPPPPPQLIVLPQVGGEPKATHCPHSCSLLVPQCPHSSPVHEVDSDKKCCTTD